MLSIKQRNKMTLGSLNMVMGFSVLMIVFGHCLVAFPDQKQVMGLRYFIKLFVDGLLPLFFILAGYRFKKKPVLATAKKSARELLIPYLLITAAVMVIYPISTKIICNADWDSVLSSWKNHAVAFGFAMPAPNQTVLGMKSATCGPAWFFPALFWGTTFTNLALQLKKSWQQSLVVVALVALGYVLQAKGVFEFSIAHGMIVSGYFYLGYLMKKGKWLTRDLPVWIAVLVAIVALVEIVFGRFDFAWATYQLGVFELVGAAAQALTIIYIFFSLDHISGPISNGLRKAGRYSFWIICLHAVERTCAHYEVFLKWFPKWATWLPGAPYAAVLINFVFSCILLLIGCNILRKIVEFKHKERNK